MGRLLCVCLFAFVIFSTGVATSQELLPEKIVTLGSFVEQGLRQAYEQHLRKKEEDLLRLELQDSWTSFWFPQLEVIYQSEVSSAFTGSSLKGRGGIETKEYTIFNWGKDFLLYKNKKDELKGKIDLLQQGRRDFKHRLILLYFELLKEMEVMEVYKTYLRHASFIYRFDRDRLKIQKTSKVQFLQARNEYLRSRELFEKAKESLEKLHKKISFVLGDPAQTRYQPQGGLIFQRLKVDKNVAKILRSEEKLFRLGGQTTLFKCSAGLFGQKKRCSTSS